MKEKIILLLLFCSLLLISCSYPSKSFSTPEIPSCLSTIDISDISNGGTYDFGGIYVGDIVSPYRPDIMIILILPEIHI